jgi:hypothetical protein
MKDLSEQTIGEERLYALVRRDKVVHDLECERCGRIELTRFWLAVLGWTGEAFLVEAYPEFYGDSRG